MASAIRMQAENYCQPAFEYNLQSVPEIPFPEDYDYPYTDNASASMIGKYME